MIILETEQEYMLRMKNLERVRDLRELIFKERSLARSAFERLTNNQKRYLLIASGIDSSLTDWNSLTDNEVKALLMGIKRLKIIISEFVNCSVGDFKKQQTQSNQKITTGLHNESTNYIH